MPVSDISTVEPVKNGKKRKSQEAALVEPTLKKATDSKLKRSSIVAPTPSKETKKDCIVASMETKKNSTVAPTPNKETKKDSIVAPSKAQNETVPVQSKDLIKPELPQRDEPTPLKKKRKTDMSIGETPQKQPVNMPMETPKTNKKRTKQPTDGQLCAMLPNGLVSPSDLDLTVQQFIDKMVSRKMAMFDEKASELMSQFKVNVH